MKAERNAFNVMLGDTIYSDSEVPGPAQPDRAERQAEVGEVQGQPGQQALRALRGSAGFYSQWDDHEFVNDFSPAENSFDNGVNINGRTLYNRGTQAFRDYAPVRWTRRDGLYRKFRWGKNLEVFFLDERSFRSANADEGGVCNNPQTGQPDFAPTAPQTHADRLRPRLPAARRSRCRRLPRHDPRPEPDLPGPAPARSLSA